MEITVITEEENPMLHRTDVRFRVSHAEATPDRLAVRDSLAARLNKSADEVVIRSLDTKFGMRETVGEAKVYQGADFAAEVEQEHMLVRNKIGEYEEADEPEVEEEDGAEAPEEAAEDADEPEAEPDADEGADEPDADDESEEQADEEPEEVEDAAEAEEADAGEEESEEEAEAADESDDDEETEE